MKKLVLIFILIGCQNDPEPIIVDSLEVYSHPYKLVVSTFKARYEIEFPPLRIRESHVSHSTSGVYELYVVDSWVDLISHSDGAYKRWYWRSEVRYIGAEFNGVTVGYD